MGQSARAYLTYGIELDRPAYELFPWEQHEDDMDNTQELFDDWYLVEVLGFQGSTDTTDYPSYDVYYTVKQELLLSNKLPVLKLIKEDLVCGYSDECEFIIGAEGVLAHDWDVRSDVTDIVNRATDAVTVALTGFCTKYALSDEKPKWFLSASYW